MTYVLTFLAAVAINQIIGAVVLCFLDDEDQSLYHWYISGPPQIRWVVPAAWPMFVYLRITKDT